MINNKERLQRAERAFGSLSPQAFVESNKAIIGARMHELSKDAQAALNQLRKNPLSEPEPKLLAALELLIRVTRPSSPCIADDIGQLSKDQLKTFPDWAAFKDKASSKLFAIGRIERHDGESHFAGPNYEALGTGFLVKPDMVLTCRHVLSSLSFGAEVLQPGMARIDFDRHDDNTAPFGAYALTKVVGIHPDLDIALLGCEPVAVSEDRMPLSVSAEPVDQGSRVCVIGHPLDAMRSPHFKSVVFGGIYGIKRASPGEVIGGIVHRAFHDCSTLGGSSGSPVFDMASGELVGVHCSGQFLYRNEFVRATSIHNWVVSYL
ncbi:MAG: serine protease [Myxococcota bacterium]